MKITVLMGSPNLSGNTATLCEPFCGELQESGAELRYLTLADRKILPCQGCYACQDVEGAYGCVMDDDMQEIAEAILWADCIVLASPIYAWYCPAAMKAMLDRHYGFNKFYGTATGSLWEGKAVALLLTHGYERAYATEPFVMGIERLAAHSGLRYLGMYSVQHTEGPEVFRTPEAVGGAKAFAREIVGKQLQYAEEQYRLAMRHIYGDGVPEDNVLALRLLETAHALGHVEASYNLGICYHYGYGTEIDLSKALTLYRESAMAGYGKGMELLGRFYNGGIVVEKDREKAEYWLLKAMESDDPEAVSEAKREWMNHP